MEAPHPCTVSWCTNYSTAKRKASLCAAHGRKKRKGLDPEAYEVPQERRLCTLEDCNMPLCSMGLCASHYQKRRYGAVGVKLRECSTAGCLGQTRKDLCATCTDAAHREYKEFTTAQLCARTDCEKTRLLKSILCRWHRMDCLRKGLCDDSYLELLSVKSCEACGNSEVPLVTDHKHGHHERDKNMCPDCIRGRLCNGCNTALGYLGEDEKRIEGLLVYIKRFDDDPIRSGLL